MSDTFTKILENGFTLTYQSIAGKLHHFLVIESNSQGQCVQMGEVYNPVVSKDNIMCYDPRHTEKREGRWMRFYPYSRGQKPFDFVASKSLYVAGHQEGPYSIFYSPDAKPFSQNLLKEQGKYCDLMGCYASMPKGKVHYWDMRGREYTCIWKNGKPFSGKVVNGHGSDLIWDETISTYVDGKEQSIRIQSIYKRNNPGQAFVLVERNGKKSNQMASYNKISLTPIQTQLKQR